LDLTPLAPMTANLTSMFCLSLTQIHSGFKINLQIAGVLPKSHLRLAKHFQVLIQSHRHLGNISMTI